jgi:hypothetical protein
MPPLSAPPRAPRIRRLHFDNQIKEFVMPPYRMCGFALLIGGCLGACQSTSSAPEPEAATPVVSRPLPPDSPLAKVKIGMGAEEVFATIGPPTSESTYQTGKAFIPFHFGGDNVRMAARYKGQGIITFSQDSAFTSGMSVISIDYDPEEPGFEKRSP